jgi:cytochrome c5
MKRTQALMLAAAFLAVTSADPGAAQDKPVPPQQQKMKDCAVKWKEEKAKTDVKGREAYRTFMSSCMKAPAT